MSRNPNVHSDHHSEDPIIGGHDPDEDAGKDRTGEPERICPHCSGWEVHTEDCPRFGSPRGLTPAEMAEEIRASTADQLQALTEILEERGILLTVVISPRSIETESE